MPDSNYSEEALGFEDATSKLWALNWYRFLTNDKPVNDVYPHYSLTDEEIEGLLSLTSREYDGDRYYLPFEAVALRISSDPAYATNVSQDGYSAQYASAARLSSNIRAVALRHTAHLYPREILGLIGVPRWNLHPRF